MSTRVKKEGNALPVMEQFLTIQGEGFHSGRSAYFIRLGGCDVGCVWCDVKESWDVSEHQLFDVSELVDRAVETNTDFSVITGGEPLTWDMGPLTSLLKKMGMSTHIETSGAYPLSGSWDWICLSPKKMKLPTQQVYQAAHELKVIIYNKNDFEFAEKQAERVGEDCILYLQPEWSKRETMIPQIVDYVMANPKWMVSLQTHKYLNIP